MRLLPARVVVLSLVVAATLVACQGSATDESQSADTETTPAASASSADANGGVVDVTVQDYKFLAPPTLPSGWNTLRFHNEGKEPHFLMLWRLPEGTTFDDYAAQVAPAFGQAIQEYRQGDGDRDAMLQELGGLLPEWFLTSTSPWGGVGFTSPGMTSQSTVHLEPGQYVMECYAQSSEGKFHGELGMLRPLIVTDQDSGVAEPEADIDMTLSNYEIQTTGDLTAGEHTVRVTVQEQPEGLLGHDIHLARLAEDTNLSEAVKWMDWIDRMRNPAPFELLGGIQDLPVGHTGYFTVELTPGRYAWISEGYFAQGMVQEFRIADGE